jgi:hypothetical protein
VQGDGLPPPRSVFTLRNAGHGIRGLEFDSAFLDEHGDSVARHLAHQQCDSAATPGSTPVEIAYIFCLTIARLCASLSMY